MSEAVIFHPDPLEEADKKQMREIFFESSTRKEFANQIERDQFEWKYLGLYLKHFPDFVFLAKGDDQVLGYCLGAPVSDTPFLLEAQPHLEVFRSQFKDYPAHLHINLHEKAQGQGIGAELVKAFLQKVKGCHIMTGVDSRNRSFYQRLGFDHEFSLPFKGNEILLMGRR